MPDTKLDAATIVSARNVAATLARKQNGQIDFVQADRIFDWVVAPVMEAAAERQAAAVDRMAKARAAKKVPVIDTPSAGRPMSMKDLAAHG